MGVEFQEENNINRQNLYSRPTPKMAAWLISKGIAKDEAGANKVEIFVAIVCVIIAIYFFFK